MDAVLSDPDTVSTNALAGTHGRSDCFFCRGPWQLAENWVAHRITEVQTRGQSKQGNEATACSHTCTGEHATERERERERERQREREGGRHTKIHSHTHMQILPPDKSSSTLIVHTHINWCIGASILAASRSPLQKPTSHAPQRRNCSNYRTHISHISC